MAIKNYYAPVYIYDCTKYSTSEFNLIKTRMKALISSVTHYSLPSLIASLINSEKKNQFWSWKGNEVVGLLVFSQ